MEDMRGVEFRKEFDKFLTLVKDNGIASIAFADNEDERMRLLGVMQEVAKQEILVKRLLMQYETDMNLDVIADEPALDYETLATGGPVLQSVKVDGND